MNSSIQDFVDGIEASVAVVGRNGQGQLQVTACNDEFFQMAGGRRPGLGSFPLPLDTLVPNYARNELRIKIIECLDSDIAQELEQAYDLREGTRWWRLSLKPFEHVADLEQAHEILITGIDITPKMLLTHQLEVSTSRFRSVVDAAYDAIITMDQQHQITLFNRAAENLFGYGSEEVLGHPIDMLLPEQTRPNHAHYVQQFARSPVRSRQMDERNRVYGRHRDGTLLPVEIAISKINVDGLIEFTAIIRDIADRVRLMDLLQQQAVTDTLTNLPNRRQFLDVTHNLLSASGPLAMFILDIDFFKKVNDTYGHDIGDEVLRVLARLGTDNIPPNGLFARWGGEEFVGALPMGLDDAHALLDKFRDRIALQDFEHAWSVKPVPFTVSIGLTQVLPGERDVDAIIKRADQALYRAKAGGRNRVELAQ